jgi:hypothetical protein
MRFCAAAVVLVASLSAVPATAQSFTLITAPASAKIFGLDAAGNRVQLGVGTAKIKLEKNAPNRYWVTADGFATLDTTFVRDIKYPKSVTLTLVNRVIKVTALPYDAVIKVNGEARGTGTADVVVGPGVPVTVEVMKGGFKPIKKVYHNDPGVELPNTERFELQDRLVNVQPSLPRNTQANTAQPTVSVDGTEIGAGNVDVVVPLDKCVTVTVSLPGYKPEPRTLCNKADKQVPAGVLPVPLVDRLISVSVTPATADVMVDGKIVGKGTHDLIVRDGSCVTVFAGSPGYNTEMREFCNADNRSLDSESRFNLDIDESYNSSVQSDQANVNFTIEVGPGRTKDQAWQTISQVVLSAFDVLEITDKDTGYLRTSWAVTKFSGALIRTRVIVKAGSENPLKYVVKLASERSEKPGATVKDDETFSEWPRLMKSYKDIINELQARLR